MHTHSHKQIIVFQKHFGPVQNPRSGPSATELSVQRLTVRAPVQLFSLVCTLGWLMMKIQPHCYYESSYWWQIFVVDIRSPWQRPCMAEPCFWWLTKKSKKEIYTMHPSKFESMTMLYSTHYFIIRIDPLAILNFEVIHNVHIHKLTNILINWYWQRR